MRHRLFILARTLLCGWATLFLLSRLIEHPLVRWSAPFVGASWVPTMKLALDCCMLAATGWVVGRLSRPVSMLAVVVFAATLAFWDLDSLVGINVPWLIRLVRDALSDSRFLVSLLTTLATHAFLFGCLGAGGLLSRPREKPLSVVGKLCKK